MFFKDKFGNEIPLESCVKLYGDTDYFKVGCASFEDGSSVSTVWLGPATISILDISHFCFESALLDKEGSLIEVLKRYRTLEEAAAGHSRLVSERSNRGYKVNQSSEG